MALRFGALTGRDAGPGLCGLGLDCQGSGVAVCVPFLARVSPPLTDLVACAALLPVALNEHAGNWHGPGESDCLIKTKHRDGPLTGC